jgi:hypothetical protein
MLGRELSFGQRQLHLRQADFGKKGADQRIETAFVLLRAVANDWAAAKPNVPSP